jgi:hypothetical protein
MHFFPLQKSLAPEKHDSPLRRELRYRAVAPDAMQHWGWGKDIVAKVIPHTGGTAALAV